MPKEYSIETCRKLTRLFCAAELHRPMRIAHYDPGTELEYEVQEVGEACKARARVVINKFVGGGFAGQVYKVKLLKIDAADGPIKGLQPGREYAMKILIPPSGFSRLFRNVLYWIGFQGPFQLQSNPSAAMAGAIWQKFIRRGAKIRFGDENQVVDIHAVFIDDKLGSCGELSEWVVGRTWRLEVDDRLDWLKKWKQGKIKDENKVGSPEYRTKYTFMHDFVDLLHELGGHEFARQYEWSTCKSQPNCLKRSDTGGNPRKGLVAVDFRAGLALLPFLPMSPGDFKLIWKGLMRRSLVQFDRGDIAKLERYVETHENDFRDMAPLLQQLKTAEAIYRNSVPDITHHHFKLLYSNKLWSTILKSAVNGWRIRNLIDDAKATRFNKSKIKTMLFFLLGLMPFLGKILRRIIGRPDWRAHYKEMFSSWNYFKRAFFARMAEKAIAWHRDDRIHEAKAQKLAQSVGRYLYHIPFSILPAGLHRLLTDWTYAKDRLDYLFIRPVRLYFNNELREEWLSDMVTEGKEKQILSTEDAEIIMARIKEPFIQKYLKSLAVHVCTLPVTQIVSVLVALIYIAMHPEMPRAQAWGTGLAIIALFQVVPISPGSLVRGFYVLYLVIRERNFKDYNIAVFLGFFKYIGYLAFPIQMAYRYPELARFMARHWANESVHIVPVFGENGALLEHWVYCLFYNWPLTLQRRIRTRMANRAALPVRYWHTGLYIIVAAIIFGLAEYFYYQNTGMLPDLNDIWYVTLAIPFLCGILITLGFGGAGLGTRFVGSAVCGFLCAALYTLITVVLSTGDYYAAENLFSGLVWRVFIFTILFTIGSIITEIKIPDPELP